MDMASTRRRDSKLNPCMGRGRPIRRRDPWMRMRRFPGTRSDDSDPGDTSFCALFGEDPIELAVWRLNVMLRDGYQQLDFHKKRDRHMDDYPRIHLRVVYA